MTQSPRAQAILASLLAAISLLTLAGCAGVSGNSNSPGTTKPTTPPTNTTTIPAAPTSLQATAGNAQVTLAWMASTSATSYHVKRATTSGGPYTQVSAPTTVNFTDTAVTNGTTYFYVVAALNSAGESPNSAQASARPVAPTPPAPPPPPPPALAAPPPQQT